MSAMGDAWTTPAYDRRSTNPQVLQTPGVWEDGEDTGRFCEMC